MHTIKPLVSICCMTYNHADYIANAIEGFLIQRTNFPFEILIHDDASTDKTPEIISKYELRHPQIIRSIFQSENQDSKKLGSISARFIWPHAQGKYIALCDGDDYWTDPYKLQKQVDFLEKNPDFGLIFTEVDELNEANKIIKKNFLCAGTKNEFVNTFEDYLINSWFIAPCTWVFRANVIPAITPLLMNKKNIVGDLPLLLGITHDYKIHFLNQSTAVYRILDKSASHFTDRKEKWKFGKSIYEIKLNVADYYQVTNRIVNEIKSKYFKEYFTSICLFENPVERKEAFRHLKTNHLLTKKEKMVSLFSYIEIIRVILRRFLLF